MRTVKRYLDASGKHPAEWAGHWSASLSAPRLAAECCLTSKDYTQLEGHLHRVEQNSNQHLLAWVMRAKLAHARVVLPDDVDEKVVTGGSRVVYSVGVLPGESRMLVHWDDNPLFGDRLRVATLLGATLLGMRAGQEAPLFRPDGSTGRLFVRDVPFQPEAVKRQLRRTIEEEDGEGHEQG